MFGHRYYLFWGLFFWPSYSCQGELRDHQGSSERHLYFKPALWVSAVTPPFEHMHRPMTHEAQTSYEPPPLLILRFNGWYGHDMGPLQPSRFSSPVSLLYSTVFTTPPLEPIGPFSISSQPRWPPQAFLLCRFILLCISGINFIGRFSFDWFPGGWTCERVLH